MIPLTYNARSLFVRRTTSLMTALGVALVVLIVALLYGFVDALRRTIEVAGEPGHYIVLTRGVTSEVASYVRREQYQVLRTRPEITTDDSGATLISPEMVVPFNAAVKRPASQFQPAVLRGMYPIGYRVHGGLKIVNGRWPGQGQPEMAIGRKQLARYPELGVGSVFKYGRRTWTMVGVFADDGSARESEFLADIDVLQQDTRYENGFSALHVVLDRQMVDGFRHALESDARLTLHVMSAADYYAGQADVARQLRTFGFVVAIVTGIGAVFGGMNTMYAAVARRSREVGVLRALGFERWHVLGSFVVESLVLALFGAVIGDGLAAILTLLGGLGSRVMSVGPFVFNFALTPAALLAGALTGATIGLLGGLMPAWRAARLPVVEALREV